MEKSRQTSNIFFQSNFFTKEFHAVTIWKKELKTKYMVLIITNTPSRFA